MADFLTLLTSTVAVGFFAASMRLAIPIMLAALGGLYNERAGVLNVGLEGMMIVGALVGFVVGYFTGNLWWGVLAAMVAGAGVGLLLGLFVITLAANQVVAGISFNLLAVGLTSFIYRVIFGTNAQPRVEGFSQINIPVLSQIPVIGPLFFQQSILTYLTYALLLVTYVIIFHSAWGLQIIATGENPEATETLGVKVTRVRYISLLISGLIAGLGGAVLSLDATRLFLDNMTAGRGYIALAILVLGRRRPLGILGAALLFGAADALQLRAQLLGIGIPFQFMLMLPYLLTMIVLAFFVSRSSDPAALGTPYRRSHGDT
jgi:general nucleoside transport system permease protein